MSVRKNLIIVLLVFLGALVSTASADDAVVHVDEIIVDLHTHSYTTWDQFNRPTVSYTINKQISCWTYISIPIANVTIVICRGNYGLGIDVHPMHCEEGWGIPVTEWGGGQPLNILVIAPKRTVIQTYGTFQVYNNRIGLGCLEIPLAR